MSADAWTVQAALYQALLADAGLKAVIGDPPRLYDEPPADAAMPYLVLGEARLSPLAGHDGAFEHELRFLAVSRHGGRREVKQTLDALIGAVEGASLAIAGRRIVSLAFAGADVPRRDGAGLFTASARVRIVTEAAP